MVIEKVIHANHRYTKKICLLEVVNCVISFPELNFSSQCSIQTNHLLYTGNKQN